MLVTEKHVKFKAVRASGPGGQRANRRSTKVQLWVKVSDLPLTDEEKNLIRRKLGYHINHKDEIWVENEEERSQELNRDKALERLNEMIEEALQKSTKRIPGEPTKGAREYRIKEKKITSEKKKLRRKIY